MITPAQRAEIRRLSFGEHWKIGTIAAALGVHHETVRAALQHETGGLRRGVSRPSALDPFLPFIRDTLTSRARRLSANKSLGMRDYPGQSGTDAGQTPCLLGFFGGADGLTRSRIQETRTDRRCASRGRLTGDPAAHC